MKEIVNDLTVVSLPHRDWSCEAIKYRIKLMPMPGVLSGGKHFFVIIEDVVEFLNHPKSRNVLFRNILSRYSGIPARRIHFIFFTKLAGTQHGMNVKMFNFDRDENRQPLMKNDPIDYSSNTAMCSMVMF